MSVLAAAGGPAITSFFSLQAVVALVTLTVLEVVLGIDNIIFISVLTDRLPRGQQNRARVTGLALAMILRVLLLLCISWIMSLTAPIPLAGGWLAPVMGDESHLNWRDAILLAGGLFLIYKATTEIHEKLEAPGSGGAPAEGGLSFASALTQILILDIVFSLDSVITAVGMVQTDEGSRHVGLGIMIAGVVIAVGVMLFAARPISEFVNRHPTVKMLAFSFLILVGAVLVIESTHRHVPKGYIYFAMAFAIAVEMLNLKRRQHAPPVHAHGAA